MKSTKTTQNQKYITYRKDVLERFKSMLIGNLMLPLEVNEIAEDTPLFGLGLGLDSIDTLEVVVGIEQEFNILIKDEDIGVFRSVNTIVDYIIDRSDNPYDTKEGV